MNDELSAEIHELWEEIDELRKRVKNLEAVDKQRWQEEQDDIEVKRLEEEKT